MRSCAASAGIAGSSSSGTRRGATTWNGSSAGASTPTARCAAGWSRRCSSGATSASARSRTAAARSAACRPAGARPAPCVLAFSTFGETPPAAALFGRGASRVANLGLPAGSKLETACTNPAALGQQPIGPVDLGRSDAAVRPRHADRGGNLAARAPMAGCATTFVQSRRGLHRSLLPGGRRPRAADRLCPRHAGPKGVSDGGMGPAPRRRQHRPGRPRKGPAEPDPRIRPPVTPESPLRVDRDPSSRHFLLTLHDGGVDQANQPRPSPSSKQPHRPVRPPVRQGEVSGHR